MAWQKSSIWNYKVPNFDRYLKKAGCYSSSNTMIIIAKMGTLIRMSINFMADFCPHLGSSFVVFLTNYHDEDKSPQ